MTSNSNFWKTLSALAVPVTIATAVYFLISRRRRKLYLKKRISSRNFFVSDDASTATLDHVDLGSPPQSTWTALGLEQPIVIAMVGLPARGKSYIVKMIIRYLKWTGFECDVFNVGSYRRKIGLASADSNFFAAGNKDAKRVREEMAMAVQEVMYEWLHEGGEGAQGRVAIFDATNTTKDRRLALAMRARKEGVHLLFVESICDDAEVLSRNYEMKLHNDDYNHMDPRDAREDFMGRVRAYEKVYETIEDDEDNKNISYIKLINVGQKVITRNCTGYLPSQVAFYLQNVHIQPRRIYLSLNCEHIEQAPISNQSPSAKNGASSSSEPIKLTDSGKRFSRDIAKYLKAHHLMDTRDLADAGVGRELMVLAGTDKADQETLAHLQLMFSCYNTPLLNDMNGANLRHLTKEEIQARYPAEYAAWTKDKLNYRYPGPGGESYHDVIERIRPVIIELERQRRSVLVICHLAVARCIHAYFTGTKLAEIPNKRFQRHVIYELSPASGGFGTTCHIINPTDELSHM